MYCSSCGTALAEELSYCNRCGAKLAGTQNNINQSSELFPESLVWAIVTVFIIGLGSMLGLMAIMKTVLHTNEGLISAVVMLRRTK